jgi:hypothetical protein
VPTGAKQYIVGVIAVGSAVFATSLGGWASLEPKRYLVYLVLALLASLVKLRLPGLAGTYSLNFLLVLAGIAHFGLPGTLAAGCAAMVVQSVWNTQRRPTLVQVLFNMANLAISVRLCFLVAGGLSSAGLQASQPAALALIAAVFFFVNTILVSGVLSLLEGKPLREVGQQWYLWAFPYYLIGAALIALLPLSGQSRAPESWLILLPLLYLVHFYYGLTLRSLPARNSSRTYAGVPAIPARAVRYISATIMVGLTLLVASALYWRSASEPRFWCFLVAALLASTFKVRLPRMTSTISLNFVLLLVAIAELSFSEAVVMSAASALLQSVWRPKHRPKPIQVFFNSASLVLSTALAYAVSRLLLASSSLALLAQATVLLYGCNTLLVAIVLWLTEDAPMSGMWWQCYFWSFPYYAVGAAAAYLVIVTRTLAIWQSPLLALAMMTLVYLSYRLHVNTAARASHSSVTKAAA